MTDCLNFGSPERPEILWQFAEAIEGIALACRALELPVVGGNVSFYNETSGQAILADARSSGWWACSTTRLGAPRSGSRGRAIAWRSWARTQ